ncbi:MAG: WXG100 family type VII secretion target, partial [Acidimicrobiia bacterium]
MSGGRPGNWGQVGGNPAPGRPEAYLALARQFEETAENAAGARRRLTAMRDGGNASIWRGKAADAFRDEVGPLAEKLGKLHDSYVEAAQAMTAYGATLQQLQAEAASLLDEALTAIERRKTHEAERAGAAATDPGTLASAGDALDFEETRLRLARERLERIGMERRAAEAKAVAALDKAGGLGIPTKRRSPWDRALGGITALTDDVWDATGGQVVSGVAQTGRGLWSGAEAAVGYIGDNWQGLLAAGAVAGAGAAFIVSGVGVGVVIGIVVGAGSSALSQALTEGEIDWSKAALNGG